MNEAELLKHMHPSVRKKNANKLAQSAPAPSGPQGLDKDSPEVGEGRSGPLTFSLELRPMATKNSRQNRGNYTAINPTARARLELARSLLRSQHQRELLTGQYDLEVLIYYSNGRSWCDSDNALQFVMDALKETVTKDDAPKYIRDATVRPRLSRYGRNLVEIILTPVL